MTYDLASVMPQPVKPRRRRLWIGLAAVMLLLIGGATYLLVSQSADATPSTSRSATPKVFTISGTLRADYRRSWKLGQNCFPIDYKDIDHGTQVTITDSTGKVVALGALQYGVIIENPTYTAEFGGGDCAYQFAVTDVPTGLGFYGIEVGRRGVVRYAEADLLAPVELTLK